MSGADRFADHDVGLAMSVPHGWVAASNDDFPLLLLAPEEQGYRASVGVRVGPLEPATPAGLEALIEGTKAARAAELPAFQIVAERVAEQAGYPGWQLRSTWESEGRALTQIAQLFVAGPDRCYEVTATCLRDTEREYLPVLRAILDSWAVLDPGAQGPEGTT